ncbi:MAG: hypothetical protein AB1Z98_36365 [Nannocystaceae bacterium]
MKEMIVIFAGGTLLGVTGCAGPAPALPPETGSSTMSASATAGSVTAGPAADTGRDSTLGSGSVGASGPGGCTNDEDCGGATPACDLGSGECVECRPGAGHCAAGEYCDPAARECLAGCDDDTDCPGACDVEAHVCVGCVDAEDCGEPTPVCNGDSNTCVECVDNGDCPTGECQLEQCVSLGFECMDDSVCDVEAGEQCCLDEDACMERCMVPCDEDADCPAAEPPMECDHSYCLFTCREDADCAAWPGFECRQMNTVCRLP